jgi:hypothetical protein
MPRRIECVRLIEIGEAALVTYLRQKREDDLYIARMQSLDPVDPEDEERTRIARSRRGKDFARGAAHAGVSYLTWRCPGIGKMKVRELLAAAGHSKVAVEHALDPKRAAADEEAVEERAEHSRRAANIRWEKGEPSGGAKGERK